MTRLASALHNTKRNERGMATEFGVLDRDAHTHTRTHRERETITDACTALTRPLWCHFLRYSVCVSVVNKSVNVGRHTGQHRHTRTSPASTKPAHARTQNTGREPDNETEAQRATQATKTGGSLRRMKDTKRGWERASTPSHELRAHA